MSVMLKEALSNVLEFIESYPEGTLEVLDTLDLSQDAWEDSIEALRLFMEEIK